jgi:hypothetical protein
MHTPKQFAVLALAVGMLALAGSAEAAAPANDDLANAVSLSGPAGSTNGTDVDATFELNELSSFTFYPSAGDVWHRWTAPSSGLVAFRATDPNAPSDADTILAADTGNDITSLNEVASNDDYPVTGARTSRIVFEATQGTTYDIGVGAFASNTQGPFGLEWGASDLYDTDNPNLVINGVTTGKNKFSVSFAASDVTADEAGSSWLIRECKLDAGQFSVCSSPYAPTNVPGGTHTWTIRATDGAGNETIKTGTAKVKGRHGG